jgi:hypothetical protein
LRRNCGIYRGITAIENALGVPRLRGLFSFRKVPDRLKAELQTYLKKLKTRLEFRVYAVIFGPSEGGTQTFPRSIQNVRKRRARN